jgi:hypothetical protein
MFKAIPAVLLAVQGLTASPLPAPSGTSYPIIYRVVSRPLCAELHQKIRPAIGMMLQNDATIKRGVPLFSQFNRDSLNGVNGSSDSSATSGGAGTLNDAQNITILRMENLVSPIAKNIIAIQTLLDSPELMTGTGSPADDERLQPIREKLLKALATQSASLDIINGFVQTQQMGDLQHAGEEYINEMNGPNTSSAATPTPNPFQNPDQIGLPANPYDIDLANVPGLALGYNPVTRLLEGLQWTIDETATRETDAANAVMASAPLCNPTPAHTPVASPTPH